MKLKQTVVLIVLASISAGGAYWAAQMSSKGCDAKRRCWLGTTDRQTVKIQEQLDEQTAPMIDELAALRRSLYLVVADPCQPDSVVIDKQNEIAQVHHKLVSTVFENIIDMRSILPAEQKDKLIGICEQLLAEPKSQLSRGHRYGQMHSNGQGGQRGMGRRMRNRGFGFSERLQLDPGQQQKLCSVDPDFKQHSAVLTGELLEQMDTLRGLIADETSSKEQIMSSVEKVLQTHSELENRSVEHLLKIRPYLHLSQNETLGSMCRRFPREAEAE